MPCADQKLCLVARTQPRNPGSRATMQCRVCALQRDNKPETLITTPLADCPWQVVATDLFELNGVDYLIVIDYFSRYVEVVAIQKTVQKTQKSSEVISTLKTIFAGHGIPE